MSEAQPQFSKTLEELEGIFLEALVAAGVARKTAATVAETAIDRFRHTCGGENFYVSMGLGYDTARRNVEIRRRIAAGEDPRDIRREFRLSERQLRRILKRPKF